MVIIALGRYRCFTDISPSLRLHETLKDLGNLREHGNREFCMYRFFFSYLCGRSIANWHIRQAGFCNDPLCLTLLWDAPTSPGVWLASRQPECFNRPGLVK